MNISCLSIKRQVQEAGAAEPSACTPEALFEAIGRGLDKIAANLDWGLGSTASAPAPVREAAPDPLAEARKQLAEEKAQRAREALEAKRAAEARRKDAERSWPEVAREAGDRSASVASLQGLVQKFLEAYDDTPRAADARALLAKLETEGEAERHRLAKHADRRRAVAVDPKDQVAVAERGKVGIALADDLYEAAMAQKGSGQNGTAFVYLERALELGPGHKKATQAFAELRKAVTEELDLIVRVDEILRGQGVAAGPCESMEAKVRLAVMGQASQRTDLGFFVLGAQWTQKVDRNEPDAPKLGASLVATLEKCEATTQTAKGAVRWKLVVPARGTGELASGRYEAEVPSALAPNDGQDAAARSALDLLSKRLAARGVEALGGLKTAVSVWPLVLAEQAMAAKDAPMVLVLSCVPP